LRLGLGFIVCDEAGAQAALVGEALEDLPGALRGAHVLDPQRVGPIILRGVRGGGAERVSWGWGEGLREWVVWGLRDTTPWTLRPSPL